MLATRRSIQTIGVRLYVSRAHAQPRPEFAIGAAIEEVLSGVEERKEKRVKKWERNAPVRAKKGLKDDGPYRNQDETIEMAFTMNLDPRKPGQALRGSLALPHGTGKLVKCAVFTSSKEVAQAALEQGAEHAGGEELVDEIVSGTIPLDFDRSLASQDMMGYLSQKLARALGPRGLMPNAKVGTLVKSPDLLEGVLQKELAGQLQYRTDKQGLLHFSVGKGSFGAGKLMDNIQAIIEEVYKIKPEAYGKGKKASKNAQYVLRAHVTSTQGKGVRVDLRTVDPTSNYYMGEAE